MAIFAKDGGLYRYIWNDSLKMFQWVNQDALEEELALARQVIEAARLFRDRVDVSTNRDVQPYFADEDAALCSALAEFDALRREGEK